MEKISAELTFPTCDLLGMDSKRAEYMIRSQLSRILLDGIIKSNKILIQKERNEFTNEIYVRASVYFGSREDFYFVGYRLEQTEEALDEQFVNILTLLQEKANDLDNSNLKRDQHAANVLYELIKELEDGDD